jgi:hypothetical protein
MNSPRITKACDELIAYARSFGVLSVTSASSPALAATGAAVDRTRRELEAAIEEYAAPMNADVQKAIEAYREAVSLAFGRPIVRVGDSFVTGLEKTGPSGAPGDVARSEK